MNGKLVIVADLGLLKAYKLEETPRGTPHLDLLEQLVLEEAHHRLVDQVTDLAGRRAGPTQRNWGAPLADAHNLDLEVLRRLLKEIADHIQRLVRSHAGLPLYLAAPDEINHQILEALPERLREQVQVNVSRDLAKAGKAELLQWFGPGTKATRQEEPALAAKHA